MNRNETTALLKRIAITYGRRLDTDTINEWTRHLTDTNPTAANNALDRIIATGEPGPTVARIIAETHPTTRETRHYDLDTIGKPDCTCEGIGFTPIEQLDEGITRWHPCPCRT